MLQPWQGEVKVIKYRNTRMSGWRGFSIEAEFVFLSSVLGGGPHPPMGGHGLSQHPLPLSTPPPPLRLSCAVCLLTRLSRCPCGWKACRGDTGARTPGEGGVRTCLREGCRQGRGRNESRLLPCQLWAPGTRPNVPEGQNQPVCPRLQVGVTRATRGLSDPEGAARWSRSGGNQERVRTWGLGCLLDAQRTRGLHACWPRAQKGWWHCHR